MASSVLLLAAFLATGAVLLVDAGVALPPDNRIFGGTIVNITSVPWQVALIFNDTIFFCGGTIISPQWILSAAHCTHEIDASFLTVRVGSNRHADGGEYYRVEKVFNHEEYDDVTKNDISVLKTTLPMAFSDRVGIAKLPEQDAASIPVGTELLVSGWGRRDNVDMSITSVLYAVNIRMVEFSECEEQFGKNKTHEDLQICAYSFGRDSCDGDSGGPLILDKHVVGIVSYGINYCGNFPAVYTMVTAYRDWIARKTGV